MKMSKKIKRNRGSITMLVLILTLVALFLLATMISFIFRDVGFTELDENQLRALNLAESGISDMYKNLDKYYNDGDGLPSSPYTIDIVSEGEPQGSVIVNYDTNSSGGTITDYTVTAKGVDKSGIERTVSVKINVNQSSSTTSDIWDYIYSEGSISFTGNDRAIQGPFYTEGNVILQGTSGFVQDWLPGPIIIEGDLKMWGTSFVNKSPLYVLGDIDMGGNAEIKGGPVSVGSSLLMDGSTVIDYDLESPLIVMDDLKTSGNARIGESGKDLDLSVHGDITDGSGKIYYTPPLGSEVFAFEDPGFDVGDIVSEYRDTIDGNSLLLDDSLYIKKGNYFDYSDGNGNSISFRESSGKYILDINGKIKVEGDVEFGEDISHNKQYTINYEGKGVIFATGAIDIYCELKPEDINSFPETNLLCIVSEGTTHFYVVKAFHTDSDCENPNVMIVSIADDNIINDKGLAIRGTVISGSTLDTDAQFSSICYESGLKEAIPEIFGLPGITPGGGGSSTITFTQEWQEVSNE
jgi:hypothetical protein